MLRLLHPGLTIAVFIIEIIFKLAYLQILSCPCQKRRLWIPFSYETQSISGEIKQRFPFSLKLLFVVCLSFFFFRSGACFLVHRFMCHVIVLLA